MVKNKEQRVGVFADTANLYHAARHLGGRVNFKELLRQAVAGRKLIRAIAYVITSQGGEEQKFFNALEQSGFEVKSKELQVFAGGKKKGDWDVGIAMDMIRASESLDVIILMSGDGDYEPVVEYLQNHGLLVEVMAFAESASARIIERADDFTDLSSNKRKFIIK